VTAVRYLLESCSQKSLPPAYIGDMPRILVTWGGCALHRLPLASLQTGDIVFLRKIPSNATSKNKKYLSHVMLAMGPGTVFHCSEKRGRGCVESLAAPIDIYAQKLIQRAVDEPALFLRYIDPRNLKLRKAFKDKFVRYRIPRLISPLPKRVARIIAQYLG